MIRLLLLGTAGCHLCEQAEAIIAQLPLGCVAVDSVDIADMEHWQACYAIRIPVLYHPETAADLCWPFDLINVEHYIEALRHD
ncbi:MAG: glutaredoxin family protein [Methylovulum sp.]|nr:glutaredoxin family protein [Methylovulum sp.]